MIKAKIVLDRPDQMMATLSLTMTVAEMHEMASVLQKVDKPGYITSQAINAMWDVVRQAQAHFVKYEEGGETP